MELIQIILLGVFAETSYLTYKAITPNRIGRQGILLDTSVLIDGRIVSIAHSGLVSAKLIVPSSVVRELQFMADKADHDKRERARYGLDVITQLQTTDGVRLEVIDDGKISEHGVDEQLLELAQRWRSKLCTIDYNLNKSARARGVEVVNINELAHALRVMYLPGEKLEVKLQQQGQDSHQAVGYLDDGTMVVVDQAKEYIGQTIAVEATRILQTAAGKMMFAKHSLRPQAQRQKKTKEPARVVSARRARKAVKKRASPEDDLVMLANR